MKNEILKNKEGEIVFSFESDETDFKDGAGNVIGKSVYMQNVIISDKDKATEHLEGQLTEVQDKLVTLREQRDRVNFDDEKFAKFCKSIIDNKAQGTVKKYKEIDKLVSTYSAIEQLKIQIKSYEDNESKIKEQLDKLSKV